MDEQKVIDAVLGSKKYQQIMPELVVRITADEVKKGRSETATVKAVKNKLHQVAGAYQPGKMNYERWLIDLKDTKSIKGQQAVCFGAMQNHASTKERMANLETFYFHLFTSLPKFDSILDVACGLNPLTLPWMALPAGTQYYACDVYLDMVAFFNQAILLLGVKGEAFACDVVAGAPTKQVDVALVLKTIPCIEQVDKNAGARLLDGLNAKQIVVSFPTMSLGGRAKGMRENYTRRMLELTDGKPWNLTELDLEGELVFVIEK